jgi:hypothetical protein
MSLWVAFLFVLPPPGDLPQEMSYEEPPLSDGYFGRLYGGVWGSHKFKFSATQTSGSTVSTNFETLGSFGVDVGGRFYEHWVAFASLEGNFRTDVQSELLGLSIGYRDAPVAGAYSVVPDELMVYAGALGGRFQVTTPGFGDFKDSVGGRLGIDLLWKVARGIRFTFSAEWRYIVFEYKPSITQGDSQIGGGTYWFGAGFEVRF